MRWKRWTPGYLLRVPVFEGRHTSGLLLEEALVAYFDCDPATLGADLTGLFDHPLLFRLWTHSVNEWPRIGSLPIAEIPEAILTPPWFFLADSLSGRLTKTNDGGATVLPATPEECQSLERAAVWSASQVIRRLQDHYAGGPPDPLACSWFRPGYDDVKLEERPGYKPQSRAVEKAESTRQAPWLSCVQDFFFELDQIEEDFDELTDTQVREAIHSTLDHFFVWGLKGKLPVTYYMFSAEGDRAVAGAMERFLKAAESSSEVSELPFGQSRLEALENGDIKTPRGHSFDHFIGSAGVAKKPESLPEDMFEIPDYGE